MHNNNLKTASTKYKSPAPSTVRCTPIEGRLKSNQQMNLAKSDNNLNRAFCYSSTKTPISKSTTNLNSYQTPTSLYRNLGTTPQPFNRTATPKSSTKIPQNSTPAAKLSTKNAFETPKSNQKTDSSSDYRKVTKDSGEISNLTVAVRVRPMNSFECKSQSVTNIISVDGNELTVAAGQSADNFTGLKHTFQYDYAYWSCNDDHNVFADQQTVFNGTAKPLVDKAFEGYNACLFAYGQTGSGKSYSMMGIDTDDDLVAIHSEAGIIPRFCYEIFDRIKRMKSILSVEIEISYFEIYNEKIHDLLVVTSNVSSSTSYPNTPINKRSALKVREHPIWGPYVVDLSTHPVDSYSALKNWLTVGNSQRATASTGMNDKSSRSHSIFNIILNLSDKRADGCKEGMQTKRSKISLVDLAGSERINNAYASADRLREGVSINKSLLTLGKVIAALADCKKSANTFVPYRESVLTWLLRENLGGNSRTVMLATISPASVHIDETLSTLRYACQARSIVNRVKVNEDPHDRQIRELRAEIERLQAIQQDYDRQSRLSSGNIQPRKIIIETTTAVNETEVLALRQQLCEREKELMKAQRSWNERLVEAEYIRKTEMQLLKQNGLALQLSTAQKEPCLINLAADPMLSGTLLYMLPHGTVKIGRSRPSAFQQPDIVLDGPLVAFSHCTIENTNGLLFIIPEAEVINEFETYVNGELLYERRQIFHGDRIVIGGTHYFRLSNPNCPFRSNDMVVDFQLAHHEIMKEQENRLRSELDAEKKAAFQRIEAERNSFEQMYLEKLSKLEMEKFRYKCSAELLETEKEALAICDSTAPFQYKPIKSNILEELTKMMHNPTEESLHYTQLKVREATQRCRDIGLRHLEFKQIQIANEYGIFTAKIHIIDRRKNQYAEWPTSRLDVWLDLIRDSESLNDKTLFDCVDVEWKDIVDNDCLQSIDKNESILNSSHISLDVSAMKDAILGNVNDTCRQNGNKKPSNSNTLMKSAVKNQSSSYLHNKYNNVIRKQLKYDDDNDDKLSSSKSDEIIQRNATVQASNHLKDIRKATGKLKLLFNVTDENQCSSIDLTKSVKIHLLSKIEQIECLANEIKITVTDGKVTKDRQSKSPKSVRFLID